MIDSRKSFECPHCSKGFLYKERDEAENHIKNCPNQYKDVREQFKKRMENKNLKN